MGVSPPVRHCFQGRTLTRDGPEAFQEVSTVRYDLTVTTARSEEVCHIGWTLRDDEETVVLVGSQMGEVLSGCDVEIAFAMALSSLWSNLARSAGVQGSLLDANGGAAPMSTREF
jgi:hypothetical protein